MAAFAVMVGMSACAGVAAAQEQRRRELTFDANLNDWVDRPSPTPGSAEAELQEIRRQIKEGRSRQALGSIKRFVKRRGESHALYPHALVAQADALIARQDYYEAHVVLQTFLNEFGGIALTSEALRLEFVIAETYLRGVKRKLWGMRLLSGEELAFEILDELSTDYPDSRLAELALKTKADYLFTQGEHLLAEMEYARLLRNFPQSRYHQFAMRRSANAALASFGGVEYDEAALIEADERFDEYRRHYPGAPDVEGVAVILDDIREKRAEKEYSIGSYYERTGHVSSAVHYYQLVRSDWPETIGASKAGVRLEVLGVSVAGRSQMPMDSPPQPEGGQP